MNRGKSSNDGFLTYLGGLRGLAILMIVLFHLMPEYFSQGFLGVEIFLVISGYLLFRGWKEEQPFHLREFIQKKIVRIVPLLSVLVIVTVIVFALIALEGNVVRMLGRSALFSLMGVSNVYYAQAYSDYFAPGANLNPLLHTWYLSVTIQVFVIWALGSVALCRVNRRVRITLLAICAVSSFCYDYLPQIQKGMNLCGISVHLSQDASYYGCLNRMWQVLAGGLVFFSSCGLREKTANLISSVSFAVILIVAFSNINIGPIAPFVVVVCTVLLLGCLPHSCVKNIVELAPFTLLGKISFSLYIAHFPVIVFYKQWIRNVPAYGANIMLLCIMLVLACLLWILVEKRKTRLIITGMLYFLAVFMSLVVRYHGRLGIEDALFSKNVVYPVYKGDVLKAHSCALIGFDEQNLLAEYGTYVLMFDNFGGDVEPLLALGDADVPPEYVFVGDSNAQHFYPGFNALSAQYSISGVHLTSIVIPKWDTYVDMQLRGYNWDENKALAFLEWLRHQTSVHTVVVSQLWSRLLQTTKKNWNTMDVAVTFEDNVAMLRKFCEEVKKTGKQVVLVMPSPRLFKFSKDVHGSGLEYLMWLHKREKTNEVGSCFTMTKAEYMAHYSDVITVFEKWEKEGFCKLLHIEKGIFRNGDFSGYRDGVLRVRDETHITPPEAIEILQTVADDFVHIMQDCRKNRE